MSECVPMFSKPMLILFPICHSPDCYLRFLMELQVALYLLSGYIVTGNWEPVKLVSSSCSSLQPREEHACFTVSWVRGDVLESFLVLSLSIPSVYFVNPMNEQNFSKQSNINILVGPSIELYDNIS